ncbi:MAG: hypothetical protein AABZ12_03625 [Planctomycetota bacterium]
MKRGRVRTETTLMRLKMREGQLRQQVESLRFVSGKRTLTEEERREFDLASKAHREVGELVAELEGQCP